MKKNLKLAVLFFLFACSTNAQKQIINVKEVERIENRLASDAMRGRKAGTPDIDKAANFIAGEFKKAGLQPVQNDSYLQEFTMLHPNQAQVNAEIDGQEINTQNIIVVTSQPKINIDETSGYLLQSINEGEDLRKRVGQIMADKKNTIVFVNAAFEKMFPRLAGLKRPSFKENTTGNVIFISGVYQPKKFKIEAEHTIEETKFANVAGILPGKSKKDEYVIFSAHYDHLGVIKSSEKDSIYNGANDDAAGVTAVIMLANYFKKLSNNERTIVFVAFTAEEIGGFGSQYFSKQYNPEQVMAMFNIEMIGTESKWGKNSAYITGYEKTDMGSILQKNLNGTSFKFYPDPYTKENLFYRSDNATLARLGVPAHTISTSKMDNEPNYHKASDEVKTLDTKNMAQIILAIAQSSKTIVSGKETPSRVQPESLK